VAHAVPRCHLPRLTGLHGPGERRRFRTEERFGRTADDLRRVVAGAARRYRSTRVAVLVIQNVPVVPLSGKLLPESG